MEKLNKIFNKITSYKNLSIMHFISAFFYFAVCRDTQDLIVGCLLACTGWVLHACMLIEKSDSIVFKGPVFIKHKESKDE